MFSWQVFKLLVPTLRNTTCSQRKGKEKESVGQDENNSCSPGASISLMAHTHSRAAEQNIQKQGQTCTELMDATSLWSYCSFALTHLFNHTITQYFPLVWMWSGLWLVGARLISNYSISALVSWSKCSFMSYLWLLLTACSADRTIYFPPSFSVVFITLTSECSATINLSS